MERQCPWFSKRRDLLVPSFTCSPLNQFNSASIASFKQTSAQLSHEPIFYSHHIWFYSEIVSVLPARCAGRSQIRLELASIQCLAQRHFSRLCARYRGPRAQQHCPATPTLTVDTDLKDSVLHWIFLSCTFSLGLSKETEINQWLLSSPNRKLLNLMQSLR